VYSSSIAARYAVLALLIVPSYYIYSRRSSIAARYAVLALLTLVSHHICSSLSLQAPADIQSLASACLEDGCSVDMVDELVSFAIDFQRGCVPVSFNIAQHLTFMLHSAHTACVAQRPERHFQAHCAAIVLWFSCALLLRSSAMCPKPSFITV
jgi:hypothetical protein